MGHYLLSAPHSMSTPAPTRGGGNGDRRVKNGPSGGAQRWGKNGAISAHGGIMWHGPSLRRSLALWCGTEWQTWDGCPINTGSASCAAGSQRRRGGGPNYGAALVLHPCGWPGKAAGRQQGNGWILSANFLLRFLSLLLLTFVANISLTLPARPLPFSSPLSPQQTPPEYPAPSSSS